MLNVTINGIPLSAYKIAYVEDTAPSGFVAKKLNFRLGLALEIIPLADHASSGPLIVVGSPYPAEYGEALLSYENGNVIIEGNDVAGLTACASYLASLLTNSGNGTVEPSEISYIASLQPREEYVSNADAFLPVYRFAHEPPKESLTLEEKNKALNDPQGRPFIIAHRCEHTFYPENSLEGAISAWRCGADSAEIDIQKTSDGVWMCMHDADITRTTNADEFMGTEGFPSSPLLRDWTYAQLRTLRLKDAFGQITPFPIPTLKEILKACDGRIYVHIDKRYSVTEDLFPVMEEMGIYKCVYFITNVTFGDILDKKDHFSDKNIRLDSLPRPAKGQTAEELAEEIVKALPGTTPAIIPVGDYVKHGDTELRLIKTYGEKLRIGAWFLRDFDTEELWRKARAEGISIFMTNRPMDMISLLTD